MLDTTVKYPAVRLVFPSLHVKIEWLQARADLGDVETQHQLGALYLEHAEDLTDLHQAYKWLFIAIALGNTHAEGDLIKVHARLDVDEIDEAYTLVEAWFAEKFDDTWCRDESRWSPELLRWRFQPSLVH